MKLKIWTSEPLWMILVVGPHKQAWNLVDVRTPMSGPGFFNHEPLWWTSLVDPEEWV